jgi:hypothetical protein
MNTLFGNARSVFGGVVALSLAVFWALCAFFVRGNGAGDATFFGIMGLAALSGFAGVLHLVRASLSGLRPAPYQPESTTHFPGTGLDQAAREFDADAAIARYLAKKEAGLADAPEASALPPREPSSFGRKSI